MATRILAKPQAGGPPTGNPPPFENLGQALRVVFLVLLYTGVLGTSQGLHQYAAAHPQQGFWQFIVWGWRLDTISGVNIAIGLLLARLGIPSVWKIIGPFVISLWKQSGEFLVSVARAVRGLDNQPRPSPRPDPVTPPQPTTREVVLHALKVALTGVVVFAAFGLNRGAHEYVATLQPVGLWQHIQFALEVNFSQGLYLSLTWLLSCWAGPDLMKIIGPIVSAAAAQTTEFAKNIGRAFRKGGRHLEEPRATGTSVFTLANVLEAAKVFVTVIVFYGASGINKGIHLWALTIHPQSLCQFLHLDLKTDSSQGAFYAAVWLLSLWAGPAVWQIVSPVLNSASNMVAEFVGKFAHAVRSTTSTPADQD
jgi:hypothetical protein